MNRKEFMARMESLLAELPEDERSGVLEYYNDYLDEAGPEAEADVLVKLGSPEKVARVILAGMEDSGESSGEFTERGYEDSRFDDEREIPDILHGVPAVRPGSRKKDSTKKDKAQDTAKEDKQEYYYYGGQGSHTESRWDRPERDESRHQPRNRRSRSKMSTGTKILLIVLLCIFAIPIGVPVLGGLFAALAGIVIGIAAVFCSAGIVGAAFVVAGLAVAFVGFVKLFLLPGAGILMAGLGLMLAAVGLILFSFFIWLCGRVLPGLVRWIISLCRKPFRARR